MKKRILPLFLIALLTLSLFTGCGKKQETPVEDFAYERKDGEIVITGYSGMEREIVVPSEIDGRPVTIIGENAFSEYDLTSITLPDSVKRIEDYAFSKCRCLKNVQLPETLAFLGVGTFEYCVELEEISLPDNVELETYEMLAPSGGGYDIIAFTFPENTTVVVSDGSYALEQLQKNDRTLHQGMFDERDSIKYTVK